MKYKLIKSDYTDTELLKIRNDLTLSPKNFNSFAASKQIKNFQETQNHLVIPMQYGIKHFGHYKKHINPGEPINIPFNGSLRDYQQNIVSHTLTNLNGQPAGAVPTATILSLSTGSGKTVIGLDLVSQLKTKTLIVVHKQFLLNQWLSRIHEFLPSAKVGIIQGTTCDIEDKDIVIGMLQSLVLKSYPSELFKCFGLTILDESHHLAGDVFGKVFLKIGATKYTIGLSATPYRKDGLTPVLEWHMGDIFTLDQDFNSSLTSSHPVIKFFNLQYSPVPEDKFNVLKKLNMPAMLTDLINDPFRNNFIINTILSLSKNRKSLILSDRIAHLQFLYKELNNKSSQTVGLYIGKMKDKDLQLSNQCDIILGSYSMCSEGYDCPDLDTLFMVTPKSDITQSIGRIFRKHHDQPLIVDFCDTLSCFKVQGFKRKRIYRSILPNATLFNIPHSLSNTNSQEIEELEELDTTFQNLQFIEE